MLFELAFDTAHHDLTDTLNARWIALYVVKSAAL